MREEPFLGGNLNQAVRVGDTVRRRAGPWTPAVHALLRSLEDAGFEAPRVLGMDERGREILGYIPGMTYWESKDPVPDPAFDEKHLVDAARLLCRYHDIVAGFSPPVDAHWRLIAPTAHELICHNDWSPWNSLFREGRLVVMLDWDLAGPVLASGMSRTRPTAGPPSSRRYGSSVWRSERGAFGLSATPMVSRIGPSC